jgi:hypothetical protein
MKWTMALCFCLAVLLTRNLRAQEVAPGVVYHNEAVPNRTPPPDDAATPIDQEGDGKKSMFRRHDNRERVVEKKSEKPAEIKKLKYGGDQSEGSGRFKGSMLEEEADVANYKKALAEARAARVAAAQASVTPSPTPLGKSAPSPSPSATASPRPSASP